MRASPEQQQAWRKDELYVEEEKVFTADLHIHSRYSRATSRDLSPAELAAWARIKGIDVVGTGDFTHPAWRKELTEQLQEDPRSGLYTLRGALEKSPLASLAGGAWRDKEVFFCLQCEISSIYKKNGRVRKIHNLIFVPTLEDAERFSKRLERVGNLGSDGRPILGLDAHDLLEMLLDCVPDGVLIPAHVWTPWFSLFGSKSGFDSVEECFGDLTPHIFALETGLSSDPPMNRYVSALDRFALVSNSDAHSANKLAREANVFEGKPSYSGMFSALRASARRDPDQEALPCRFVGTIEFFPEEGKYHLDGHRNCNVSLDPFETRSNNMLCPVCHKPVTVGVLHRVMDLADRRTPVQLDREPRYRSVMPLLEMTAELMGFGVASRKVQQQYEDIIAHLGSELDVLCSLPLADISSYWDLLGEACSRLREGRVLLKAGYDGEFGQVHLFADTELGHAKKAKRATRRSPLPLLPEPPRGGASVESSYEAASESTAFDLQASSGVRASAADPASPPPLRSKEGLRDIDRFKEAQRTEPAEHTSENGAALRTYTPMQEAAIAHGEGPALVLAGPGAGKTHLLMGRIAHLVQKGMSPTRILAISFTRRAAAELRERLQRRMPQGAVLPCCDTLHGFAWSVVRQEKPDAYVLSEDASFRLFLEANPELDRKAAKKLFGRVGLLREQCCLERDALCADCHARYMRVKAERTEGRAFDFAELLAFAAGHFLQRTRHISPDGGKTPAVSVGGISALGDSPLSSGIGAPVSCVPSECVLPFDAVLVDEIQDCSMANLAFLEALLPPDGRGFFGIGDPDQAIYGFRGSVPDIEGRLRAIWPDITRYELNQSFRSAQVILTSAETVLAAGDEASAAKKRHLSSLNNRIAELRCHAMPDERVEASFLAAKIASLLGATSHTLLDSAPKGNASSLSPSQYAGTMSPGEIAVLVRYRFLIPPIAKALTSFGIPYQAQSEVAFWEDQVVADLLGTLEPLAESFLEPFGDPALRSCLTNGELPEPEALVPWAEKMFPGVSPLEKNPAFRALCALWKDCGSWRAFFQELAVRKKEEDLLQKSESVRLMTIHASKGLEFKAVFLPAFEREILPTGELMRKILNIETDCDAQLQAQEEKRLCYVAISRASDVLYVSYAGKRRIFGTEYAMQPSPFLASIEQYFRKSTVTEKKRTEYRDGKLF